MLSQRIIWLELPEKERIRELQKTLGKCQTLYRDMIKELTFQAQQVPSLIDMVKSLRLQLELLKLSGYQDNSFSLNFGNGIPPLVLNIAGDQLKMLHRALAMAFHPDKHPEDSQQYAELMKTINSWYDKFLGKNVGRKPT
jgi:ABC-type phosphate transport system auxiliary subunit